MTLNSIRQTWYSRLIAFTLLVSFTISMTITPKASYAGVLGLPKPGTMVDLSPSYVPLMISGLTIHPENPLLMDFIVNAGDSGLNADQVKIQSNRLIKYFLACLTIPENHQWVNLSPYEKQRIIPGDLGQTVLGQDMLEQDYLLKQLTASLIYPEKSLGKNFWDQVYAKASQKYGTSQIPMNTFNKVWILPEYAKVYEHKDTVLLIKSHLKVMLDEDYLASQKYYKNSPTRGHVPEGALSPSRLPSDLASNVQAPQGNPLTTSALTSNIIRQIILPAIEQEVNTGKNFSQLRQIYNSMILAVWFKANLKQALLNQVYSNKSKVNGVNVDDPSIKDKIYEQYIQAYKKGVFNYIKEESPLVSLRGGKADEAISNGTTIARKYFSGGLVAPDKAMIQKDTAVEAEQVFSTWSAFRVKGKVIQAPPKISRLKDPKNYEILPDNYAGFPRIGATKYGLDHQNFRLSLYRVDGIGDSYYLTLKMSNNAFRFITIMQAENEEALRIHQYLDNNIKMWEQLTSIPTSTADDRDAVMRLIRQEIINHFNQVVEINTSPAASFAMTTGAIQKLTEHYFDHPLNKSSIQTLSFEKENRGVNLTITKFKPNGNGLLIAPEDLRVALQIAIRAKFPKVNVTDLFTIKYSQKWIYRFGIHEGGKAQNLNYAMTSASPLSLTQQDMMAKIETDLKSRFNNVNLEIEVRKVKNGSIYASIAMKQGANSARKVNFVTIAQEVLGVVVDYRKKYREFNVDQDTLQHLGVVRIIFSSKHAADQASLTDPSLNGGIDLNSKNLNLQREGDKITIAFNKAMIAQFKRGDFSGVQFNVLDVEPINLMLMFS